MKVSTVSDFEDPSYWLELHHQATREEILGERKGGGSLVGSTLFGQEGELLASKSL